MQKIIIEINSNEITLDNLIKLSGLANSGGQAGKFISDGLVKVNDDKILIKRKKITLLDKVTFADEYIIELKAK